MRQHRRQRDHERAASGASIGDPSCRQWCAPAHHDDIPGRSGGANVKIDQTIAANPWRTQSTLYSLTGEPLERYLIDQRSKRASEGTSSFNDWTLQKLRGNLEKRFGRHIRIHDPAMGRYEQQRIGHALRMARRQMVRVCDVPRPMSCSSALHAKSS